MMCDTVITGQLLLHFRLNNTIRGYKLHNAFGNKIFANNVKKFKQNYIIKMLDIAFGLSEHLTIHLQNLYEKSIFIFIFVYSFLNLEISQYLAPVVTKGTIATEHALQGHK